MINSNIRIGFIGFGSMGQAICDGLIKADAADPGRMSACAGNWDKLLDRAEERGIKACTTASEVVDGSDLIIVAVKPELVRPLLEPIKDMLIGKAVISVAYGCDYDFYDDFVIDGTNHLYVIPNTPVSVCEGIMICEKRHSLTSEQMNAFRKIFSSVAVLEFVETRLMEAACAISGCGPAFAALFIEALGDAGVKHGLRRETAYKLAAQMTAGTGALQMSTGNHPASIKDAVCSPGGTTVRGIAALEECGFRNAVIKAVDAAMLMMF